MFDKILEFINENEAKLFLLIGTVFIVLSSFNIDISKPSISFSSHPSYPVLAVGILAFVMSAVFMKKTIDCKEIIKEKETELKAAKEKADALQTELTASCSNFEKKENELKDAQKKVDKLKTEIFASLAEIKTKDAELKVAQGQLDEVLAKQSLCCRCYGLTGTRNSSEDNVFQDFKINDSNPNAVQFLWADTNKYNIINGEIIKSSSNPCLRVRFHHKGGYGCNIAIRSKEWKALCNDKNYRYLMFDDRIPKEELERDPDLLKEICIAVRVVNGYFQHWEYAIAHKEYKFLDINTTEWGSQLQVDLTKKEWWKSFGNSDGNPDGPTIPDFSIISAVILKFGKRPNSYQEPDPGKGVIDIRALRLV